MDETIDEIILNIKGKDCSNCDYNYNIPNNDYEFYCNYFDSIRHNNTLNTKCERYKPKVKNG